MKKFLLSTVALALSAGLALADVVVGSGAIAASGAGGEYSTLGGAGSLGNGAAVSGSIISARNSGAAFGVGGTIGIASGAASGSQTNNQVGVVNTSLSQGGAGGFSGAATAGGSTALGFGFGGLGFTAP
jgi:hypothetical protein